MKKLLYLFFLLLSYVVSSCSGDADNSTSGKNQNTNANTTEKGQYAVNLEMPRVQRGNNYILISRVDDNIGVNYSIEWDCIHRAQRWTCWEWTKANSYKGWNRNDWDQGVRWLGQYWNGDPFLADPEIPAEWRTELSDFRGSGYDRGHICASEDRICSMNVNGQTFYLSNMHPQVNSFNAKVWATMEIRLRTWRDQIVSNSGTMYVCKGGTLYDVTINGKTQPGTLEKNPATGASNASLRMPVPKYFFMAVVKKTASGFYSGMAFWAEHKPDNSKDLQRYMITINELEARTGYDFFCNFPDNVEETMEGYLDTSEWK